MVRKADFQTADQGQGSEGGEAAQTKQHSTESVRLTGDFPKQPPAERGHREWVREAKRCSYDLISPILFGGRISKIIIIIKIRIPDYFRYIWSDVTKIISPWDY